MAALFADSFLNQKPINKYEHKPTPSHPKNNCKKLSETIKDKGILQPLIVVKASDNEYEIVAGERRWRAAQLANLHEIPVLVKKLTAEEIIQCAEELSILEYKLTALEVAKES